MSIQQQFHRAQSRLNKKAAGKGATPAGLGEIIKHQAERRGLFIATPDLSLPQGYSPVPDNQARIAEYQRKREAA